MKSFYVCCIISAALSLMVVGITKMSFNMIEDMFPGNSNTDIFKELGFPDSRDLLFSAFSSTDWMLLAIIAVALFITIEYNSGTLKNIAARGFSRESIFFSKFIVSIVEALIVCLIYVLVYVVSCFAFFEITSFDSEFTIKLLVNYAVNILIAVAVISVIVMLAYLLRSKGSTIAISICLFLIVAPIVLQFINIFSTLNSDDSSIDAALSTTTDPYGDLAYYWIGTLGTKVSTAYNDGTLYVPILIALAYIVVSTGIGLLVFKKRDIK